MRKMIVLFTAILLVALSQVLSAQTIVGSGHDFSGENWNSTGEICVVCHTPHNALQNAAPLWNHQLSTVASYTLYSSATLNATMGQPDGSSKLCLSCHDGTVALENFGGTTGGTHFMTGVNNLGTDFSNDHPISFTYNTALATADGGLFDPSTKTVPQLGGGTIANTMLFNGKVQCASCHDVHNSGGTTHLLLFNNAVSALCLTCHNK